MSSFAWWQIVGMVIWLFMCLIAAALIAGAVVQHLSLPEPWKALCWFVVFSVVNSKLKPRWTS